MMSNAARRRGSSSSRSSSSLGLSQPKKTTASVMEGVGQDVQLLLNRPINMVTGMAPPPFFGEVTEDVENFVEACRRAVDYNRWPDVEIVSRLSYFLEGKAKWAYQGKLNDCWVKEEARLQQELESITGEASAVGGPEARMQIQWALNERIAKQAVEVQFDTALRRTEHEMIDVEGSMRQCDMKLGEAEGALRRLQHVSEPTEVKLEESRAPMDDNASANTDNDQQEETQEEGDSVPAGFTEAEQREIEKYQNLAQQSHLQYAKLAEKLRDLKLSIQTHDERLALALQVASKTAIEEYKRVAALAASTDKAKEGYQPTEEEKRKNKDYLAFPTVEKFYEWLCATFISKDTRNRWMSAYYGRRHKKNETVRDYSLYLTMLGHRAGLKPDESDRTQHFFNGLHKRMKMVIKRMWANGELATPKYQWDLLVRTAEKLEKDIPELCPGDGDYDGVDDEGGAVLQAHDGTTMAVAQPSYANHYDSVQVMDDVNSRSHSSAPSGHTDTVAATTAAEQKPAAHSADANDMKTMMQQIAALLTTMNNEKRSNPAAGPVGMQPPPMSSMQMATMPMQPMVLPPCTLCGLVGHLASHCSSRMRRSIVCYNCGEPGHLSTACNQAPSGATLRRQGQGQQGQGGNNRNRGPRMEVTCYRCGMPGHISPQCTQPPRNAGQIADAKPDPPQCANCNRRGHFASECRSGRPRPRAEKNSQQQQQGSQQQQGNDQRA